MEITLRKGLEPVSEAEDRPNQCLSEASFEKAPKQAIQALSLVELVIGIIFTLLLTASKFVK